VAASVVFGNGSRCETASAMSRTRDSRSSLMSQARSKRLASSNRLGTPMTNLSAQQSSARNAA
jgi:hypothetical protein